jgi:hypothetical protein
MNSRLLGLMNVLPSGVIWPVNRLRVSTEPEALRAQQASGLPRPATFERFADADYMFYRKD